MLARVILVAIAVGYGTLARATPCWMESPEPNSVLAYGRAFAEALGHLNTGLTLQEKAENFGMRLMRMHLAESEFRCVCDSIRPYLKSKSSPIKTSAEAVYAVGDLLNRWNTKTIALMQKVADGKVREGKAISDFAEFAARRGKTLEMVPMAAEAFAYGLAAESSTPAKPKCVLSSSERKSLMELLASRLGDEVRTGSKEGQTYPVAAAAILYALLVDEKWKPSEESVTPQDAGFSRP